MLISSGKTPSEVLRLAGVLPIATTPAGGPNVRAKERRIMRDGEVR